MRSNYSFGLILLTASLIWMGVWPPGAFSFLLPIIFIPVLIYLEPIPHIFDRFFPKGNQFTILLFYFLLTYSTIIWWIGLVSLAAALYSILIAALMSSMAFYLLGKALKKSNTTKARILSLFGFLGLWLAMEWFREYFLSFPWIHLGYGLSQMPALIQWYEFTGPLGGSLWIMSLNLALYEFILRNRLLTNRPKLAKNYTRFVLIGTLALVPLFYSLFRFYTFMDPNKEDSYGNYHRPISIEIIQSQYDSRIPFTIKNKEERIKALIQISENNIKANPEYLIWPENALEPMGPLEEDSLNWNPDIIRLKKFLFPYKNTSLITGAITYRVINENIKDTLWYNSSIQLENKGRISIYHKQILVPGVEKSPFSFPSLPQIPVWTQSSHENDNSSLSKISPFMYLGGIRHYFHQDAHPQIHFNQNGLGLASLICFESVFSDYARNFPINGASVFAVQSNDSWWGNSKGILQHLYYSQSLAISTRRGIAQSSNGGISALISPRGDIIFQIKQGTMNSYVGNLDMNEYPSFYSLYGNWVLAIPFISFFAYLFYSLGARKL